VLVLSCRENLRFPRVARNPGSQSQRTQKGQTFRVSEGQPERAAADFALVARIRAGDEQAMGALYDRYSGIVYAVALRVLNDSGAAEDILQEVFLQLWRKPDAFDASRGALGPWLAVITRHRAIDRLRKRQPETDIEDTVLFVEADLEDDVARAEAAAKVRSALNTVPTEQRTLVEMAFFQGLTHSEIAAQTGQPLGTVKTRIRSALLAIRKAFAT